MRVETIFCQTDTDTLSSVDLPKPDVFHGLGWMDGWMNGQTIVTMIKSFEPLHIFICKKIRHMHKEKKNLIHGTKEVEQKITTKIVHKSTSKNSITNTQAIYIHEK